jgi:hypothetical protein
MNFTSQNRFNPLTLFQTSNVFVWTLPLDSCANPLTVVSNLPVLSNIVVRILSPVDKYHLLRAVQDTMQDSAKLKVFG